MIRSGSLVAIGLLLLTGVVFGLAPELDLWAARAFLNASGAFIGVTPIGEILRKAGYIVPFGLFAGAVAAWALHRLGWRRGPKVSGRAVLFLASSLAIGPGLLVNVALKDNSHRPRPVQTQELGGPHEFRPWYRFDGACVKNCSFVSGEASTGFWTVAPALLVPTPLQPVAVGAALIFGTSVAVLRMSFGGHYLSDSLMSALLTILVVLALHRLLLRPRAAAPSPRRDLVRDPDLRRDIAPL